MQRWTSKTFLSNSSWTSPAGINVIFVQACGGGGGGDQFPATVNTKVSGERSYGGNPAMVSCVPVAVTPNTTYSIVIGAGGASQTNGSDTTFGSLITFKGGSWSLGAQAYAAVAPYPGVGFLHAYVEHYANFGTPTPRGTTNPRQYQGARGSTGTDSADKLGGNGGGGSFGAGGNGSNATTPPVAGGNAAANTGGGGGGAGFDTGTSGNTVLGGTGGSGIMTIFWLE